MTQAAPPIAVALDAPSLEVAVGWATEVEPWVSTVKVGLELYLRTGAAGVVAICEAAPSCELFLDLKLHDIPNTVAGAVRSVSHLRPKYLTVHATGGPRMISAAAQAAPEVCIAAVTVLTSMSESDLSAVGLIGSSARRGPPVGSAGRRRWRAGTGVFSTGGWSGSQGGGCRHRAHHSRCQTTFSRIGRPDPSGNTARGARFRGRSAGNWSPNHGSRPAR